MAMACITLFLLVFVATSNAASISSHGCNLNTPPLSASGDDVDMTTLSQVDTSLQYCMIDNCTIMRIDTGEELDIVYTTESLLVAVSTDGHTSEVVLSSENEVPCFPVPAKRGVFVVLLLTMFTVALGLASGYVVVVHLLFPELRNEFGILLMSYNATLFAVEVYALVGYMMNYGIAVGSQLVCQAMINGFMFLIMILESYSTCVLFHITYTIYRSFKLKSKMPKNLLIFYNCFVFGLLVVFAAVIIGYDVYSGNGKQTILPSGHCLFVNDYSYETQRIKDLQTTPNKIAQLCLFIIFLFCYRKQRNTIVPTGDDNYRTSIQISKQLFRIAVAMGAAVGIARVIWVTTAIFAPSYAYISTTVGVLAQLLQQCVVMASFTCTRKMSRLCRERFRPHPAESAEQQ